MRCPHQESNLDHSLRTRQLYPLSYRGIGVDEWGVQEPNIWIYSLSEVACPPLEEIIRKLKWQEPEFFIRVDRTGFEPVTSSMPWRRATNCANGPYQASLSYCFFVLSVNVQIVYFRYTEEIYDNRHFFQSFQEYSESYIFSESVFYFLSSLAPLVDQKGTCDFLFRWCIQWIYGLFHLSFRYILSLYHPIFYIRI